MSLVADLLRELWGLFVDDGFLALALLLWVAVAGLGLRTLGLGPAGGPVFLAGCAAILAASLMRARR